MSVSNEVEPMDALFGLAMAIVEFIVEMTIHSLVFLYQGLLALFSRRHREKLRESWRSASVLGKVGSLLGLGIYGGITLVMLGFWASFLGARWNRAVMAKEDPPPVEIRVSREELDRLKNTREIDELADVAKGIAAKWRERQAAKREETPVVTD